MKMNDFSHLGRATADALGELVSLFGDDTYVWLSGLWEGEIGGFYYSVTARDNDTVTYNNKEYRLLPDIESTVQAIRAVQNLGMLDRYGRDLRRGLPEEMQKKLLAFATGLQSEDDGFFYHPQWGKAIIASRRGRDNSWATSIVKDLGGEFKYPLAADRLKSEGAASTATAEHLKSLESFKKYLDSFDFEEKSYPAGNTIGSQGLQIKSLGYFDFMMSYLTSKQKSKNGLWEENISYKSINGLMKISGIYSGEYPYPNAEAAVESLMAGVMLEERPGAVVDVYNPWAAAVSIIGSHRQAGNTELADRLIGMITDRAPELIRRTAEKISIFRKPDGSFSYCPDRCSSLSQMAPVALPETNEGDVNATCIAVNGTAMRIMRLLGVRDPGIYCHADYEKFARLLGYRAPEI